MLFFTGFGWAKPVPINVNNFTSFRKGLVLVSAAGITANFFLAFLAILGLQFIGPISSFGEIQLFLIYLARINIMLAAFNLIPIPPLDGSKILMGFAPGECNIPWPGSNPTGFSSSSGSFFSVF